MADNEKAVAGNSCYGADVGFEAQLCAAADAMQGSIDAAEYISGAFEEQHDRLVAEQAQGPDPEGDWRGELLKDDQRWAYGTPPAGNADYAWRTAG